MKKLDASIAQSCILNSAQINVCALHETAKHGANNIYYDPSGYVSFDHKLLIKYYIQNKR
jgi:hypothetical protein